MNPLDFIQTIINREKKLLSGKEEFDRALSHTLGLIRDSYILFTNERYSTSLFLSISALEEIAKTHIGIFSSGEVQGKGRRGNVFYSHKHKHLMSALPTIPIGARLIDAIGKVRVDEIMHLAQSGELVPLREAALYFERNAAGLVTPEERISCKTAKELLLFCIEAFDDALVGFTNESLEVSRETDEMFDVVSAV